MAATLENEPHKVRFKKYEEGDFFRAVKERVANYFKENGISPYATNSHYIKALLHTLLYGSIYISLLSDSFGPLGVILLFAALGVTKGLVGFNIIHDALHGGFFPSAKWNRIIGYWFDLNGTSSFIWKISHNLHHHIYTNIPGHDDDIDKAILLRLNTSDKVYWFHRYQHLYAPFLYGVISLNWVFYSDYKWFFKEGAKNGATKRDVFLFFILKALNLILFLLLPALLLSVPLWAILLGFLSMHIAGGLVISIIFQLAHIVDNVQYFEPDSEGNIENNWAIHEMLTTSNFATKERWLTELVGGLNYQVEHHLFSTVSHSHLPKIAEIVKKAAAEYGLPYLEQPTLFEAIKSHFRTLKRLGRGETGIWTNGL